MKALSIRQPYAWLIARGIKDIENRDWPTTFRGRVLIHAGLTYPKRDYRDDAESFGQQYGAYPAHDQMVGGIVGVATIVDCVQQSESKWFNGPFGFVMANAREIPFVPCKGALGFFDVHPDVAEVLRAMHRKTEFQSV
jgi:hypothetical protein